MRSTRARARPSLQPPVVVVVVVVSEDTPSPEWRRGCSNKNFSSTLAPLASRGRFLHDGKRKGRKRSAGCAVDSRARLMFRPLLLSVPASLSVATPSHLSLSLPRSRPAHRWTATTTTTSTTTLLSLHFYPSSTPSPSARSSFSAPSHLPCTPAVDRASFVWLSRLADAAISLSPPPFPPRPSPLASPSWCSATTPASTAPWPKPWNFRPTSIRSPWRPPSFPRFSHLTTTTTT